MKLHVSEYVLAAALLLLATSLTLARRWIDSAHREWYAAETRR